VSAHRGEIRTYGSHKIAVISADGVNAAGRPWCAPIVRQADIPPALAVFTVTTHESDPVTGCLLLLETRSIPADRLGPAVGSLIGLTMTRVDDGIRTMFDL
jgi:mRNA-degrading endonuclease toxin of MazEF toxin-antitoxin module